MQLSRHALTFETDTGANDSVRSSQAWGEFVQLVYAPSSDTGVRMDTGVELTLIADTGRLNLMILNAHLAPNDSSWARNYRIPSYDTGGDLILYAGGGTTVFEPLHLNGERLRATVQGNTADTGKQGEVFLYFRE